MVSYLRVMTGHARVINNVTLEDKLLMLRISKPNVHLNFACEYLVNIFNADFHNIKTTLFS